MDWRPGGRRLCGDRQTTPRRALRTARPYFSSKGGPQPDEGPRWPRSRHRPRRGDPFPTPARFFDGWYVVRSLQIGSLRHQSKRPQRATGRHIGLHEARGDGAAQSRCDRHVLPAIVGVGDGGGIDARTDLELPQRLAGVGIEGQEFAGQLAGEYQPAVGCQHSGCTRIVSQRSLPFLLASYRIDRYKSTHDLAGFERRVAGDDPGGHGTESLRIRRCELLDARDIPRVRVDKPGIRIERDRHRVGAPRGVDLNLFAGQELLVDVGQDRAAGLLVDLARPVDLDIRIGGDRVAIGTVQHVQEAVLVGLDHHLAGLTPDLEIGQHLLVGAVNVVYVVGRVLIVTNDLAGFRPDRQQAGSIEAVPLRPRPRIVGLRVAGAPVDDIELGIIGTGAPRRPAAAGPGVAVLRPRLGGRLAGRRDGVASP